MSATPIGDLLAATEQPGACACGCGATMAQRCQECGACPSMGRHTRYCPAIAPVPTQAQSEGEDGTEEEGGDDDD